MTTCYISDPKFWVNQAQQDLNEALRIRHNTNVAKNVILFIGDGMGVSTVTAARIFKGQLQGKPGEETVLAWEDFPHVGLSKVIITLVNVSVFEYNQLA